MTGKKPDIRYKGYADTWEQRKLVDVLVDMYNGQTPSRNREDYWKGNISWLSSGELNRGTVYNSIEKITEKGLESAHLRIIPKGTFVMAITGLEAPGTRGNCALLGFETTLNQSCMAFFQNKDLVTSEFLFQWYRKVGEEYGINYTQGTKQQSYNAELLKILPITLPSLAEQQKITECLFNLDSLITLHQRKYDRLTNLKKSMLEKMFPRECANVPEIRFKGFNDAWEQRKVLDLLIQPITDGPHETPKLVEKGIPFISVDAIIDNKIDFSRKRGDISEEYDELCRKKYRPQLKDVYLVKSGSTVGKVAIVETTDRFNIWSPLAAMRCGEKTDPYFLYFLLQTDKLQSQVFDKASNGTQPNLSMRELEKFEVVVPSSVNEQKQIGSYFQQLDNLITLHQRKLQKLSNIKKSLLEKMFI